MPGRKYEAQSGYRYGFNGKEKDKDLNSLTAYDYGFRIYNPGIGKFLSVDPLYQSFPWYSSYQYAGNKPIWCVDFDGLEDLPYYWQLKERILKDNAKTPEDWARLKRQEERARNIVVGTVVGLVTFGYGTTTVISIATVSTVGSATITTLTWCANPANQLMLSAAAGFVFEIVNPDPNGFPFDFPGPGEEFAKGIKLLLKNKAGKQVEFIAESGAKFENQSEFYWVGKLIDEGNNVKVLKESTQDGVQTADLVVNGIKTELKEISNITSAKMGDKIKQTIEAAAKQAGAGGNVIIDVTNQTGATKEFLLNVIERVKGNAKENFGYRVIGQGFELNGSIEKKK